MTEDFCKRTIRKTKKLGYDPKEAARLSKFCYVSMLSVGGMMGAMLSPSLKSMVVSEDESLHLQSERAQSDVLDRLNRWYGQSTEISGISETDSSDIQRRLPAL